MGSIDIDPASNDYAQSRINASIYYTKETNGIDKPWIGNVWLNSPYGKSTADSVGCSEFMAKLIESIHSGEAHQAVVLVNSSNGTAWYSNMLKLCSAFALTDKRLQFDRHPDSLISKKDQNTKGQTFFYFGDNVSLFAKEFEDIATISIPIKQPYTCY